MVHVGQLWEIGWQGLESVGEELGLHVVGRSWGTIFSP